MTKLLVTPAQRDSITAILRRTAEALQKPDAGIGGPAFNKMIHSFYDVFGDDLTPVLIKNHNLTIALLDEGETRARLVKDGDGEAESAIWEQQNTAEITVKAGDRLVVRVAGHGEVDVSVVGADVV